MKRGESFIESNLEVALVVCLGAHRAALKCFKLPRPTSLWRNQFAPFACPVVTSSLNSEKDFAENSIKIIFFCSANKALIFKPPTKHPLNLMTHSFKSFQRIFYDAAEKPSRYMKALITARKLWIVMKIAVGAGREKAWTRVSFSNKCDIFDAEINGHKALMVC